MILEESVDSSASIYLHHLGPNPPAFSSSSRKGQERVSNALEMSSFKRSIGIFFLLTTAAL
jgi:hypothetical protein